MKRRDFLKLSMYAGCSCLLPGFVRTASAGPLDDVIFNSSVYGANTPQTIMVFLYGGASELAGNFTNYDEFKDLSQSSYPNHFGSDYLSTTTNGFWALAGGDIMEELLAGGNLNVFRTCFSQVRWDADQRSHGPCVAENQRGTFNADSAGIFANLGRVLQTNGVINSNTKMPFLSMEGESGFYGRGDFPMDPILEPISINEDLDNPYGRTDWTEPDYTDAMDVIAQQHNQQFNLSPKIYDAFAKRQEMESFINDIKLIGDPELGVNNYDDNGFADKLKTAVKILDYNGDTRAISLATDGLGGWDDHNDAENYMDRMQQVFRALRSAMAHINQLTPTKSNRINIMVMGDFGRGVNLNSANGWDHGNLQTVYMLGGRGYFRTPGVVGETILDNSGSVNRLYLRPDPASYWFEPFSIASTIYSIYGITNPEVLTGQPVINPPGNPLFV